MPSERTLETVEEPLPFYPSKAPSFKELDQGGKTQGKTKVLVASADCPYPEMVPAWIVQDYFDQEKWNPARKRVGYLLQSTTADGTNIFDMCIGIVIIMNVIFMVWETDVTQACKTSDCAGPILETANYVFLGIYTIEVLLRLFMQRAMYIFSPWNILDLLIVVAGVLGAMALADVQNVQIMRIARVLRVIRAAKMLTKFKTLNTMVKGFSNAMAAMAWGLFLIMTILIIFSILAVEIVNETNQAIHADDPDNYCAMAFSTVSRSTLLFFQTLVAGDSWGECTIPIMERMPMTFALFAIALVCINLGFTNLVLAVVVDKAAEAREVDRDDKLKLQKVQEAESLRQWGSLMAAMDVDDSGSVTLQELLNGFKDEEMKTKMDTMKIEESDMKDLFKLMDTDDSGTLEYDEVVTVFHKANTLEPRIYQMLMKLELTKIRHMLENLLLSSQRKQMSGSISNDVGKKKVLQGEVLHQSLPPADSTKDDDAWTSDFASGLIAPTVEGIVKTSKRDSCCGDALPQACSGEPPAEKGPGENLSEACSREPPAEKGPGENLSEELRGLRISLEARLDKLAGEAAEMASRLSSQHALLEDVRRSSEAIARAVAGEDIEDDVSALLSSTEAIVKPLAVGDRRAAELGSAQLEGRPRSHDAIAAAFKRFPAAGAHLQRCRPEGRTPHGSAAAVAGAIQGQRASPTAEGR